MGKESAPKLVPPEVLKTPPYDVVIVMGARLETKPTGELYYPPFNSFKDGKLVDGDTRAWALSQIHRQGLARIALITGGTQTETIPGKNGEEPISRTINKPHAFADHAHVAHNVPKEFMLPHKTPSHSIGNIEEAVKHLQSLMKYGYSVQNVAFLTDRFHLERTTVFALNHPFFTDSNVKFDVMSSERILLQTGQITTQDYEEYYATSLIQERMKMEQKGIGDFRNGIYVSNEK